VLQGQVDEADVLIVDPPRKGLDEGVLQLLLDTHPEKSVPGKREEKGGRGAVTVLAYLLSVFCACICIQFR
jgi:hypothetical protein